MLVRTWKVGTLMCYLWKYKMVQIIWKTVEQFLKKLKIELPYDPAIPLVCVNPKEQRTVSQRNICTPVFTAALLTISKIQRQSKRPVTDEWINKMHSMKHYSVWKRKLCHTL